MLGDSLYLDNIEEYVQDEDKIVSQLSAYYNLLQSVLGSPVICLH